MIENWSAEMNMSSVEMKDLLMQGYSVRLARYEHVPTLPAIELEAAQMLKGCAPDSVLAETTDRCTFAEAVRDGCLWVALTGNRPVGFALVEMLADDLPHLEEIDVEPIHGSRGLGTALVRAVYGWAMVSGYPMLTLTTFRSVPWNYPFYARLGFLEIPRETLRSELVALVASEADRGLNPDNRVVMGFRCGTPLIQEQRLLPPE